MNKWLIKGSYDIFSPDGNTLEGINVSAGSIGGISSVNPNLIGSGEAGSILAYAKKNFVDTKEGWIQGMDTDNKYKWLIGNATESIDWGVTTVGGLTVKGTLTASSIHIPDQNTTAASMHVESDGDTWWGCTSTNWTANHNNATAYVLSTGIAKFQSVTLSGSVIATDFQPGTDIAIQGWTSSVVFVAADADTVTWSAGGTGQIKILDGTTYTIVAGTTGNMVARTFIYLDINVSLTVLQTTTTATTAVGKGKILVCVAQNNSDATSKASFQPFGGYGGNSLFVDSLAANSASVNEFLSNTAQIKNLIVTNAKINDLSVAKLTSGSITSKQIDLTFSDGTGDVYLGCGTYNTVAWTTNNGFLFGIDDSDSNKIKMSVGTATSGWDWNVTTLNTLTINGTLAVGSIGIQNLLENGDMEDWNAGVAVAPDSWTLSGGGSVAREATIIKISSYSIKIISDANGNAVEQSIHAEKGIAYWKGRTITFSCWAYATDVNSARIVMYDGDTPAVSSYHTGGGTWELLTVTMVVSLVATGVTVYLNNDGNTKTIYYDGAMCVEGSSSMPFSPKYTAQLPLPSDSNLVGYWSFDEGSGSTAYDYSANANAGTLANTTFVSGISGKALSFNGTTSIVTITDHATIQNVFDGGGSFSCWVYINSDGEADTGIILNKEVWNLRTDSQSGSNVRLRFAHSFSGTAGQWYTATDISISTWHHIVFSYNNDSVSNDPIIIVDGLNKTITEGQTPVGTRTTDVGQNLYIGNVNGSTQTFDGYIDEMRFYNATLTLSNAKALYTNPSGNQLQGLASDKGLVGGWVINATTLANGTNIILDASNKAISINDSTFGNTGIQLQYNGGTPRAFVGTTTNYWKFDGTIMSVVGGAGSSNMIVAGGMIHSIFSLLGVNMGGGSNTVVNQIFSGHSTANNDYLFSCYQGGTAPQDSRTGRYNRTKANAIFRDLSPVDIDTGTAANTYTGGCYDGTKLFFIQNTGELRRLDKDLTNSSGVTNILTTAGTESAMTFDGTYVCTLVSTGGVSYIERGTMSGATPPVYTYNNLITLSNVATGSLCWNASNSCWYAYDSAASLIRKYNSTGTQTATLAIIETVNGILYLEGKLFMSYITLAQSTTGYWATNCVPFDL